MTGSTRGETITRRGDEGETAERKPFHRFVHGRPFELVVKIKNTGTASMTRKGLHEGVVLSKPNGGLKFVEETHFDFPRLRAGKTAAVDVIVTGPGFDGRDGGTTAVPRACVPVRGNAHFSARGALNDRGGGITHADVFTAKQTCNGIPIPTPIRTDAITVPRKSMDDSAVKLQDTANIIGGITYKWDLDVE